MPYRMEMWCDGACRYNGTSRAVGGWGFQIRPKYGKRKGFYGVVAIPHHLGLTVNDTNNRAELTAIIQALLKAVEQQADLHNPGTRFICMLHSDSKLAVDSMEQWVYKWRANGWVTSKGTPVKNVDLIKRALDLVETIEERNGRVDFNWVRRGDNEDADRLANMGCDLAEERSKAARVCVGYALSGYANAYDSDSDTLYW